MHKKENGGGENFSCIIFLKNSLLYKIKSITCNIDLFTIYISYLEHKGVLYMVWSDCFISLSLCDFSIYPLFHAAPFKVVSLQLNAES
jgi:hypothetical protein